MNKISSIPAKSRTKSNPDGGCLQTAYQPADCTGYLKVYQQGSVVGILHWGHTSGCRRSMRWGHLGSVLNTRDLNEKFCVWRNQSYFRRKAAFIGKMSSPRQQQEGDAHRVIGRVGDHSSSVSAPVSPAHGWVREALLSEKVMSDMIEWKFLCLHHCFLHTHFISSFLAKCIIKAVVKYCSAFHHLMS